LGHEPDAHELAEFDQDELVKMFTEPPALHLQGMTQYL
jgi:hypothetical protein